MVTVQVLDIDVVNNAILYSQALAASVLVMKFMYEIWYNTLLRGGGDSDADVEGVLIRAAQSVAMIGAIPWVTKQVYMWGTAIAGDIAALPGMSDVPGEETLRTKLLQGLGGGFNTVLAAVTILIAIIVFLLVLIQTFIRAAELAVVAAVGAFMAVGLTSSTSQAFQVWWRELLNISIAQALQIFLLKCAFFTLTFGFADIPFMNIIMFCAFIWVTYKSPSIMKQYLYSTGVGRGLGQATQQAGSMVMMRKLMTKGV